MRAVGHNLRVVVVQFMKGRKRVGEYRVKDRLSPYYEIHQFGREGWVDLRNPSPVDKKLAGKALEFAASVLKRRNPPHLLILDEVNIAAQFGLVKVEDVLELLDKVPAKTTIYMTGRFAPYALMERADYVTEVVPLKRPKRIIARKGIEW